MEIFAPFFLCVIFLAAMYGLMRLSLYISNISARRSIYKSGVYTPKTTHTLLLAQFGEKHIISGKFLPRRTENGTVYERCDHILILNGAVIVATVCREDGKITNSSLSEAWTARVRARSGSERELSFENPIAQGENKIKALKQIFENAKCRFPIPVYSFVIFPSRRVSFSLPRQKEILSPPEALRTFKEIDQSVKFTKKQKKAIQKAIAYFAKTESQIYAKKRRSAASRPPIPKNTKSKPKKTTEKHNANTHHTKKAKTRHR